MTLVRCLTLLLVALLSACGSPSEAEQAAQSQLALAATVAAAPPAVPMSAPTDGLTGAAAPAPTEPALAPTKPPAAAPPTEPAAAPPAFEPPDDGQPVMVGFEDLYSSASISGPILSEKATKLNGRTVVMVGYMAPPLKPDLDFFVLTKTPMTYCPFCNTAADWPFDIVFVRMAGGKTVPPLVPTQGLRVTGTFSVGTATDPATGFVSQVRVYADTVEELP